MFSMGKFQHAFVYDKNMFIVGKFQTYMSNALSKGGLQSINCKPRSAVLFSPADFVKLLHLVYFCMSNDQSTSRFICLLGKMDP